MKYAATNKSFDEGFTLFEVIVYVAIFALIIGAVVGLAILATSQRQKDEVVSIVNLQGESVLGLMTSTIDGAKSITSPALGSSANAITLAMPPGSTNPTVLSSYNDGSVNRLEITEGSSPAVASYLTNSHVNLSNLSFTNKGLAGTSGSILISFTLTYVSSSNLQEFNYQRSFYGATTIP